MHGMLKTILEGQRVKVAARKRDCPVASLMSDGLRGRVRPCAFREALRAPSPVRVIAEIKRASPSAGLLRPGFDAGSLAQSYERHGAAAISVLTEEDYFLGGLDHLRQARAAVGLPVLRKDFIVDDYQVYEAAAAGADAVLLIAAVLDPSQLTDYRQAAEALGMDALVEVHTTAELARARQAGARVIGVNNRDLDTFTVSLQTSLNLVKKIPQGVVKVSESGIQSGDDIARLRRAGFDAFLIGEQLMRAPDPGARLRQLIDRAETAAAAPA